MLLFSPTVLSGMIFAAVAGAIFAALAASSSVLSMGGQTAFAQEQSNQDVIMILPGASDGRYRTYFDYPFYMVEKGGSITWHNPDAVAHRLKVSMDGQLQIAFDTQQLEPKKNVTFTFSESGQYKAQCSIHPHITGEFIVADDMATITHTDTKNQDVDVRLSWHPASPAIGEKTYFRVEFLDKQTGARHEHIDYRFSVIGSDNNSVAKSGVIHASLGQDFIAYAFEEKGSLSPVITIMGINWIPIEHDDARFSMVVTPEFPPAVTAAVLGALLTAVSVYRNKIVK